ncbi:hypothetical protein OS493_010499 [Desmophyllum pertusum]|uniref:Peptidase A2 domain-containing protein n=1 Tax=Desmophyllum pertusum TaxID=174260 RepID=A0A9X0A4W0_9CNID|nr:hypothetical protein OS493_010499 [Desmophyllum pertusum]
MSTEKFTSGVIQSCQRQRLLEDSPLIQPQDPLEDFKKFNNNDAIFQEYDPPPGDDSKMGWKRSRRDKMVDVALEGHEMRLLYPNSWSFMHGSVDLLERLTIVMRDYLWYFIYKKLLKRDTEAEAMLSADKFRTPRSMRLIADMSIQMILGESTALIAALGFTQMYNFRYSDNSRYFTDMIAEFFIRVAIALSVDLMFNSLSLWIQMSYLNVAVVRKQGAAPAIHTTAKPAITSHHDTMSPDVHRDRPPPGSEQQIASTSGPSFRSNGLTVEVQINGKTTRFLVDTGAAVSVLDANHMLELYDRHPPPLAQNSSKLVKTASGEDLPIPGILRTTITIAGGNYPCEFKAIEGVTYRGALDSALAEDAVSLPLLLDDASSSSSSPSSSVVRD